MQLVEQHIIKRTNVRYQTIDQAAFASKNLYNAANYEIRQAFIHQGVYLRYEEMHQRMKTSSVNADVNGSYNIVRKVAPDAFGQGGRGCVVHPTRLAV